MLSRSVKMPEHQHCWPCQKHCLWQNYLPIRSNPLHSRNITYHIFVKSTSWTDWLNPAWRWKFCPACGKPVCQLMREDRVEDWLDDGVARGRAMLLFFFGRSFCKEAGCDFWHKGQFYLVGGFDNQKQDHISTILGDIVWLARCFSSGREYFCHTKQFCLLSRSFFQRQRNSKILLRLELKFPILKSVRTPKIGSAFDPSAFTVGVLTSHSCLAKVSCLTWRSVELIIDTTGDLQNEKATEAIRRGAKEGLLHSIMCAWSKLKSNLK